MRRASPIAPTDVIIVARAVTAALVGVLGLTACMSAVPQVQAPPVAVTPAPQSAMRDFDADGFADPLDRCPNTPETRNGFDDLDGCIDEIPPELTAITGAIKGLDFATDKPILRGKSSRALDRVAAVLTRYPDVRIELAGHVDSRSAAVLDGQLSRLRAEAVRDYLITKGVATGRIETRGADANEPLASNKSGAGRARNRRVELTLLSP